MPGRGPWALDFGETIWLDDLEIEFNGEPWNNFGMLATEDLLRWFDLESITNWPVPCRAVFFDFRDDGSGVAPAVREIEWEE